MAKPKDGVLKSASKTETDNIHVDGFLKVADASVNASEVVERARLGLRQTTDIAVKQRAIINPQWP